MRLSIAFTGFAGLESTLPAVAAAEDAGLDGVWAAEHIGFHDAIVPSTAYLRATRRLEIGLVGLSTAGRHPGVLAMELLSLSELGPGRVRVAVGLGDPGLVAKLGRKIAKPLAATAAFVSALRDAVRGSDLRVAHPEFTFDGFRANPLGPPPPIDVMAIRPKMAALAARIGDGISISVGASRAYIRDTVKLVEEELRTAKRDRASFRISAMALGIVADDLDAACGPVSAMLSMFPQATAEYLARGVIEPGSLVAAEQRGPMAVMKMWTRPAIEKIALVSTPDRLGETLQSYAETGIDELALSLIGDPEAEPAIIRKLAAARPRR
jgi:alkanesulfonate monooxygenase SsuD/methylene tetrahydromethanopterin reductase-like flavin-dependent oxidoreductase (luciferase family)